MCCMMQYMLFNVPSHTFDIFCQEPKLQWCVQLDALGPWVQRCLQQSSFGLAVFLSSLRSRSFKSESMGRLLLVLTIAVQTNSQSAIWPRSWNRPSWCWFRWILMAWVMQKMARKKKPGALAELQENVCRTDRGVAFCCWNLSSEVLQQWSKWTISKAALKSPRTDIRTKQIEVPGRWKLQVPKHCGLDRLAGSGHRR